MSGSCPRTGTPEPELIFYFQADEASRHTTIHHREMSWLVISHTGGRRRGYKCPADATAHTENEGETAHDQRFRPNSQQRLQGKRLLLM